MKFQVIFGFITLSLVTTSFANVERYFESIKADQQKLTAFLYAMPKGGDLHNHESGATYAENLLDYASNDNFCINRATYTAEINPKCESQNLLNNAIKDPVFRDELIDAWSMRHFQGEKESGHDHFFSTFQKFSAIADSHRGEILAEITKRAGLENESYLELMVTADGNKSGQLGNKLGWNPDFSKMRDKLLASGFEKIIEEITQSLNEDEIKMRSTLYCDTNHPKIGCTVKVRYLYQVLRNQDKEMVFAQLLAGFESATKDRRVVGLNMVQPEDGKISMQDYKLQMQMIAYLHKQYPNVQISLHAGELTDEIAPPNGLKFHIHDAVYIANTNRIGHGVDIANEENADELMNEMANRRTMVEINLTSNDIILKTAGKNHPLPLYLNHKVPVSLSTDDEGISRINLTNEYKKAVQDFQFGYSTLKYFARNSLTYSFMPGKTLWEDDAYKKINAACKSDIPGSDNISQTCKSFLDANEKSKEQWNLEKRFTEFESQY